MISTCDMSTTQFSCCCIRETLDFVRYDNSQSNDCYNIKINLITTDNF